VTLASASPAHRQAEWLGLFQTAFKRSRNPMALLDEERRQIDVNGPLIGLLGHPRAALIGHPVYEFVADGPLQTEKEWRTSLVGPDFFGQVDLVRADGGRVTVEYAAHPEVVTGRRLVLLVALQTTRRGRDLRFPRKPQGASSLSRREIEIVGLIADGRTSAEIADALSLSANTVRTHVRNAMVKLAVHSRAQLVAKVMGEGIVLS
jgi:PAS domain S-box-containing protein